MKFINERIYWLGTGKNPLTVYTDFYKWFWVVLQP
jgi:hypothetical protein